MIKIKVTQECIDKAVADGLLCPIDFAAKEHWPDPITGPDQLFPNMPGRDNDYFDLPEEAVKFVDKYDASRKVEPFEFELDPDSLIKGAEE